MKCEEIEAACNLVRGSEMTQEQMAEEIREHIPADCIVELRGRHGQNCQTLVSL